MASKPLTNNILTSLLILSVLFFASTVYLYLNERAKFIEASDEVSTLKIALEKEQIEKEGLFSKAEDQDQQLASLANELEKVTGAVNILEKIQNTDEELLQKYSKVYFLNEHYVPSSLRTIPDRYVDSKDESERIHAKVLLYLTDMLEDASEDGIDLRVVSAYRSYGEQTELKESYTVTYGFGANAFSADQGYSEHQLGSTVDFSTEERGQALDGFETTEAYSWLLENAARYGFVLSYPQGNNYYIFEPWHWRFVGVELAQDLKEDHDMFYDWEQRRIDEYIIKLFD